MNLSTLRHLAPVALLVGLAVAGFYLATNGTGMVSQRIGEAVHEPDTRELDLSKLTSFGWDRVYYFKQGTSREELCTFVGAKTDRCAMLIRYEAVPDDMNALVFSLDGHLTHIELHARANGEFLFNAGPEGLPRAATTFRVHRSSSGGDQDRIALEPIQDR